MLAQIQKENPENVRVVYRNFPLESIHDKAALAAQAAEAAGLQGKFWEMHDLLFNRWNDWNTKSVADFKTWIIERAAELGLDKNQFSKDLESQAVTQKVQQAWDQSPKYGVQYTPYLLLNGDPWPQGLPPTKGNIEAIIQLYMLEKQQFSACPAMKIDRAKQYTATLHTDKGDIVIELFPDKAPIAVNNFIFLARSGWFNNVTFHRVLPGFVAQTGDPSGTGLGGPGYAFVNETSPDLKYDKAGMVGMANSGPDTNGSQFFITYAAAPKLDGSYTIFGQVIKGMDVAEKLTARDPSQGFDLPPGDKILSVDIQEK